MILALLLAAVSPEPAATPLKTIGRVQSGSICAMLHTTVIPVAYIERKNDDAMESARERWNRVARSQIAFPLDRDLAAHYQQYIVGVVWSNIDTAESLIRQSKRRYPDAQFPLVAQMRERAEAVLEAQRREISAQDNVSGSYLDRESTPTQHIDGTPDPVITPIPLSDSLTGLIAPAPSVEQSFVDAVEVVPGAQLEEGEAALDRVSIAALRLCEGLPATQP